MKQIFAVLLTLFFLQFGWGHNGDYHGLGAEEIHPGYDLHTIRPNQYNNIWPNETGSGFNAPVLSMEWLIKGKELLILTWRGSTGPNSNGGSLQPKVGDHPRNGKLYVLHDVDKNNRADITYDLVADNFKDAHGVKIVDGDIYVGDIDRIVKLVDGNNDGFFETHELVANIPAYDGWFEYSFDLEYLAGKFYMILASNVQNSGNPAIPLGPDRGTWISIDKATGQYEVLASGFRAPNGLAINSKGEFFAVDNQGGYRPSNIFTHVQVGKNYGYINEDNSYPGKFQSEPVTSPSTWGVHRDIAEGPTGPVEMHTGIYKGQFFVGDIGRGGIKRIFLEKVNGEYQGVWFPFTGGLEVGIDNIIMDDNGVIFAGGVGNGSQSNQGWLGKRHGLQKLVPKSGTAPFEILAVRSREKGLELEFTQPVNNNAENATYEAWTYTMNPVKQYGGGHKVDNHAITVTSTQISTDRKKIYMEFNEYQKDYVIEIGLPENFTSQSGQTIWFHHSWYTVRNISTSQPFDINGCTQTGYAEYDPNATFNDGSCATGITARNINNQVRLKNGPEFYTLEVPFNNYKLSVQNVKGQNILVVDHEGNESYKLLKNKFNPGVYNLRIETEDNQTLNRPLAIVK